MEYFELKNGDECIIRDIAVEDAEAMLDYVNTIAGESDNLTFGQGEFDITLEKEREIIEGSINSSEMLFLVAVIDNQVVGSINLRSGTRVRTKHAGEFGVSVLKKYWGLGLGSKLMEIMIGRAEKQGITKINLHVREDNISAIRMYEKFGFVKEGVSRRMFLIDGEYIDCVAMGLLIN